MIFAGAGEFGVPTLRALITAGHGIIQVITQPDRPAGRGRTLTPTPVSLAATELGLPVLATADINTLSLPAADLLVVIAFGQKIGDAIVYHPRLGSINLHASLLPRHRGAAPINAAILSGDDVTGNSVIRLAQKMDAGAILGQSTTAIGELETAGELHDRLSIDGAPLVLQILEQLAGGAAVEREQDSSAATLARKMSRETARIDWSNSADAIARQIRGLWPWPGCRVSIRLSIMDGEKVIDSLGLVRARAVGPVPGNAGEIVEWKDIPVIAAGDGNGVQIVEVQPAGRKAMLLDAYARGNRWEPGLVVRSA